MGFDRPPQGISSHGDHDGVVLELLPYLSDHGARDLRRLGAGAVVVYVLYRGLLLVGYLAAAFALAGVALVAVAVALVAAAVHRGRRERTELELRIGPNELRLTESLDGRPIREERLFLRDIGRVDAEEVGYQRHHVVANVVSREPLRIPMERHSTEAASWLARELAEAGRAARGRDGAGLREVPKNLRRLTE